jgi:hypothetical protein
MDSLHRTSAKANCGIDADRRNFLIGAGSFGAAGSLARCLPLAGIFGPALACAADRPGGTYYSHQIDWIGYHDLAGKPALQMAMQVAEDRYYLYLASFYDAGWHILDVTDPANPSEHRFLPSPGDRKGSMTVKIQVADGLMLCPVSQAIPHYHGNSWDDPHDAGVYIFDVGDPLDPKLLSQWQVEGFGAHRSFYNGGRYAHISATAAGFGETGMIYRIVDLANPRKPVEVGRWWVAQQWKAGGGVADSHVVGTSLHGPPYVQGNLAYLPYGAAGLIILDISDVRTPKLVGQLQTHPPLGGDGDPPLHSAVPLSDRPLVVISSEGKRAPTMSREEVDYIAAANFIGMVDVSKPSDPKLISLFPAPVPPPEAPYRNFHEIEALGGQFGFGPHNLHQPEGHPALENRTDRVYCAYFNAGLRIYDISDRYVPREIAWFIPPNPEKLLFERFKGPRLSVVEDVLVDHRGNIFITTNQQGLFVLRSKV